MGRGGTIGEDLQPGYYVRGELSTCATVVGKYDLLLTRLPVLIRISGDFGDLIACVRLWIPPLRVVVEHAHNLREITLLLERSSGGRLGRVQHPGEHDWESFSN